MFAKALGGQARDPKRNGLTFDSRGSFVAGQNEILFLWSPQAHTRRNGIKRKVLQTVPRVCGPACDQLANYATSWPSSRLVGREGEAGLGKARGGDDLLGLVGHACEKWLTSWPRFSSKKWKSLLFNQGCGIKYMCVSKIFSVVHCGCTLVV